MNRKMNKEGEQCASRVELDNGVTAITDGIVQMDTDLKQQITDSDKGQTDLMTEHDISSENNHRENCNHHGSTRRLLWVCIITVAFIGAAYGFNTIAKYDKALEKSDTRVYSLKNELVSVNDKLEVMTEERDKVARAYVNLQRSQKQVTIDKAVAEKEIESLNEHILDMYKTAENEAQKNAEYYKHKDERIEGLTDHVMFLNDQGEQQEQETADALKLAERYRSQRDTKNQFMAITRAITDDNPARLCEVLGDEDFTRMVFYKQAVQCAIGLQSLNIVNYIQTLEGWDKTIPQELASRVTSPQMVPLADYQKLKAGYDQQAGRIADLNKKNSRKENKRLIIKNEKFEADHDTSVVGGQEEAENLGTPLFLR